MDYYDVGDTVTLLANFTVRDEDGVDQPTDPASVTGRVRPPNGVIFDITPLSDEVGEWKYPQVGDAAGDWRWEIVGDGNADGVQAGAFRVRQSALDAPNANTFVTPDDIETALRRTMSLDEYDAADQLVNQLVAVLELRLNRDLVSRTYTGERHVIRQFSDPLLWHGPVGDITSISQGGASVGFDSEDPWCGFYDKAVVYVDYTTIADHPQLDAARGVVINAVVRSLLQGPKVASGAIKSYSVEGTSITYGDNTSGGQGGRITVGDLSDIMRMKRRVIV